MIPGWKVKREFDRFWQQLRAGIGLIWEPFVQRRYDRMRESIITISDGARPAQEKVAVYLIFQPKEILKSTLQTCRMLDASGYAPFIVSNAPLPPDALAALGQVSWRIMQRPNYGYDFGGYRDGILHLRKSGITPDKLLVMNDSIWYPLGEVDTLLSRLEASGLDVAGTIVHRGFRKTLLRRRATRVIESYLFLFSAKAIQSRAFESFWGNYRMSSIKYNAVHRGERRVAETMLAAGLSADGLFGREEFMQAIATQNDGFLRDTLRYGAYTDDHLAEECAALLSEPTEAANWRSRALDHVARTTLKRNFHGAFVFASMQLLDMPYLKKGTGTFLKRSYGTLYTRMRAQYVAAVMANDLLAPRVDVLAEIIERDDIKSAASIGILADANSIGNEVV